MGSFLLYSSCNKNHIRGVFLCFFLIQNKALPSYGIKRKIITLLLARQGLRFIVYA